MQLLQQSEATAAQRRIPVYLVDATDGYTPETGITFSAGDIKVSKNGGAEANHGGSVTELAGGIYYYEATAAELDTAGFITIRFTKAGVRTFVALCQVVPFDPYDATALGLTRMDAAITSRASQASLDVVDDFVDTEVSAIKAKTDNLPADPADASDVAAAFSGVNSKLDAIDDFVDTEIATLQGDVTAIKAKTDNLPSGVRKNTALNNFEFLMVDSGDHVTPKTGLTITAQRSIDGGAFASATNAAAEVGNGIYKINLSAADLNGDVVTLKFTASGADPTYLTLITEP